MYIHMYMCVCVDSLAAQVFFKMIPSGSFPHLPKKKGELGKDQPHHRCGEPWPKPFDIDAKKGENYTRKRGDFHRKN